MEYSVILMTVKSLQKSKLVLTFFFAQVKEGDIGDAVLLSFFVRYFSE